MTPARRRQLREAQRAGYLDGSTGASYRQRSLDQDDDALRRAYETGWHVSRYEKLGIAIPTHINPIDAEEYAKALYCEEAGESLVVLGSGGRFGIDERGRDGEDSPRRALAKEMGDVLAAIEYACQAGLVDRATVETGRDRKLAKLLSPASRDNHGRRLAPSPLGHDDTPEKVLVDMAAVPYFVKLATPDDLIGRRIIRYMPELPTEYPDDMFAGWQLDDQDTWIVFAHPSAASQIRIAGMDADADMTFVDMEVVSANITSDRFEIVAVPVDRPDEPVTWDLSPGRTLGRRDDVRHGMVVMRRPAEMRDR